MRWFTVCHNIYLCVDTYDISFYAQRGVDETAPAGCHPLRPVHPGDWSLVMPAQAISLPRNRMRARAHEDEVWRRR